MVKHTKFVYSGNFRIMDSNGACCTHCGNKGYLKYHYLGLESKIKNWFKTEPMCKKMLFHWNEREHWLGREEYGDNFKREYINVLLNSLLLRVIIQIGK